MARGVAPQFVVAVEVKLDPLMVSVNAAPPAATEAGLRLVIVGGGWLMVKVELLEAPLIVVTVTLAVPREATRLAGTKAVNCVGLM